MNLKRFSKFIAIVLAICLVMPIFPVNVFAKDNNSDEPELISLTVTNSEGEKVPLLNTSNSIHLGKNYSFEAKFSNADEIDSVYIMSTRQNETKIIEANWNGSSFVSDEIFDNDSDYIPGRISVKYTKKTDPIEVSENVDWEPMISALENQVVADIENDTEESLKASVDISKLISDEMNVAVDVAVDIFDAENGTNLDEFLGQYKEIDKMTKYVISDEDYSVYLDYTDPYTYATIIKDASGNKWIKMILNSSNSEKLNRVAEKLGNVNTISSLAYDYLNVNEESDKLRDEIDSRSDISNSEKKELNEKIDAYEKDRQLFNLSMAVIPAVVAASVGAASGTAIVFSAILGVLNAASGTFWDYRIGMITGGKASENTKFTNDAHGIPLTHSVLSDNRNTITESGVYYLETSVSALNIGIPDVINSLDVTLCLHGHYASKIINNGCSLHITSCVPGYEYDVDGGKYALGSAKIYNYGGNITIDDAGFEIPLSEDGDITINGGRGSIYTGKFDSQGKIVDIINNNIYIHGGSINRIVCKDSDISVDGGSISTIENENGNICINDGELGYITGDNCDIFVDGGIIKYIENNNGTLDIENGNIVGKKYSSDKNRSFDEAAIKNTNGVLNINGGSIDGEIWNRNKSVATIKNADINSIINRGKSFEIFNANVSGNIENDGRILKETNLYEYGEMIIHNGNFKGNISNSCGTLTINGGTFIMETDESNLTLFAHNFNSIVETTINGGEFYSNNINIGGGNANSENKIVISNLTINGGSFYTEGKQNISFGGNLIINDGYFKQNKSNEDTSHDYGNVYNSNDMLINGGKFLTNGYYCVKNEKGNAIISNGEFKSTGYNAIKGNCTLLINKDSLIEMEGNYGAISSYGDENITIKADNGYDKGVNYKSRLHNNEEIEKNMNLIELQEIINYYINDEDALMPLYIRIAADGYVPTEPDEPITSDKFKIIFDANGGTITDGSMVEYTVNGKLSSIPTAKKEGYVFKGWYTALTGGNKVTKSTVFDKDTTIYAIWNLKSSKDSSSDDRSSSKKYTTISNVSENGNVIIDKANSAEGTIVTITPKAADGYVIDKIDVIDKFGNKIKLIYNDDGTYTFTMPASNVEINAEFAKIENTIDEPMFNIIKMQINSNRFWVNGVANEEDVAPIILNDRTLVPIRFITEALDGKVDWNPETKEITLTIDDREIKMTVDKTLERYNVASVIIGDRTYVPVRFVADELGAETMWEDETKTVTITKIVNAN